MQPSEPLVAQELPRPPGRMVLEVLGVYLPLMGLLLLADHSRLLGFLRGWPMGPQIAFRVALPMAVGLGCTWLFVRREPSPRAALGLSPRPLPEVLGFGGLGFLFAYAGNATLAGLFLAITRTPPTDLLAQRTPYLALFGKVPLAMVLPLALVVGFYEELVFRGFVLGRLRHACRALAGPARADVLAVVGAALLFGSLHLYQGWYGMFQTAGAGLGLGAIALWRRSTWPAVVAHALVDAVGLLALHLMGPLLQELSKLPPPH